MRRVTQMFEQAGIAVPAEGATWEEWATVTKQVADATETPYAMSMDRSGHRFAALILLWLGRGPVQGFGVTLAIGIITTLYAALIVTRLMFDYWLTRNPKELRI